MATSLQFLTGRMSSVLTQKNDSGEYEVAINPGSVYFTTDSKIYFDLNADTRLCMAEGAAKAAEAETADRFSSGRTIRLNGPISGATESTGADGWSIDVSYDLNQEHPFVKKAGDEITGALTISGGSDTDSLTTGALNLSNKNITNVNGLYITQHEGSKANQGIHFIRTQGDTDFTHADTLYAKDGNLYFAVNREKDKHQGGGKILTSNNFTDYAVRTDGSNATKTNGPWNIDISGSSRLLENVGFDDPKEWVNKISANGKALVYYADAANDIDRRSIFLHNENTSQLYGLLLTKEDNATGAPLFSVYDYTNNVIYPLAYTAQLTSSEVAKRLQYPIELNGISFYGNENRPLTTATWGPEVTFKISDATEKHTGNSFASNGSTNVNLLLPSRITASLEGLADKADALNVVSMIGSPTRPMYIDQNGKPQICDTTLEVNTTGNAATATIANSIVGGAFRIGHAETNYTGGNASFDLDSIGTIDTLTAKPQSMIATLSAPKFIGALEGNAATASLAYTIGTNAGEKYTVGSSGVPVYFAEGIPVVCSGDLELNAKTASKWQNDLEVTIGRTAKQFNADRSINWTFADLTGNSEAVGLVPITEQIDEDGITKVYKIPESYLPSYIDDVREGYFYEGKFYSDAFHITEMVGVSGIIYVDITNLDIETDELVSYRWSGSSYVKIASPLSLGDYTGSAFDGYLGHQHINNTGNPHEVTTAQIAALNVVTEELQTVAGRIQFNNVIDINQRLNFSSTSNTINIPASGHLNFSFSNDENIVNTMLMINSNSLRPGADALYNIGYPGDNWTQNTADWSVNWSTLPSPNDTTRRIWNNIFASNMYANYYYGLSEKATRLADYNLYGEQKTENDDSTKATAKLIYFENGLPQNSSINIGGIYNDDNLGINIQPVYVKNGYITPFDCNIGEDFVSILGIKDGRIIKSSMTIGGPVIDSISGSQLQDDRAVYLKNGVITACADTLMHNISGNAATASKLNHRLGIRIGNQYKIGTLANEEDSNSDETQWNNSLTAPITKWEFDTEEIFGISQVRTKVFSCDVGTEWQELVKANSSDAKELFGSQGSGGATYIIQILINDNDSLQHKNEYYSGIMSWSFDIGADSNNDEDEIILHKAGKGSAGHNIYLRTKRINNGYLSLQIAADTDDDNDTKINFTFKTRKII